MSWQDYVDNQLIASQCVSKACIAGHDGGVWAKSEGFDVSIAKSFFLFHFSSPRSRKFRSKLATGSNYGNEKKACIPWKIVNCIDNPRPPRRFFHCTTFSRFLGVSEIFHLSRDI